MSPDRRTDQKAHIVNRRLLAASLCAAALVLPACSDKADPAATPSPAASATPADPASASATPTPKPSIAPANNLDAIKVEGERLKEPKVDLPAPWAIDETRTKVLVPGDGAAVAPGGTVEVHYYGVNARTGKKFDDSYSRGQSIAFPLDQVVPGFKKGLEGQKVGSRVLIAMPGKDGYDASGGSPQAGIEVGDTLVFVVDLVSTPLDKPEGDPVPPQPGQPTVTADASGAPHVQVAGDKPTQLVVSPIIKGKGKPVTPADTVTVRYVTVGYDGRLVETTFGKPAESGPLAKLIPAWKEGLVGQPVGSRVMLLAPGDKAYPDGNDNPKIQPNEPLIFVVDILYTQSGQ